LGRSEAFPSSSMSRKKGGGGGAWAETERGRTHLAEAKRGHKRATRKEAHGRIKASTGVFDKLPKEKETRQLKLSEIEKTPPNQEGTKNLEPAATLKTRPRGYSLGKNHLSQQESRKRVWLKEKKAIRGAAVVLK